MVTGVRRSPPSASACAPAPTTTSSSRSRRRPAGHRRAGGRARAADPPERGVPPRPRADGEGADGGDPPDPGHRPAHPRPPRRIARQRHRPPPGAHGRVQPPAWPRRRAASTGVSTWEDHRRVRGATLQVEPPSRHRQGGHPGRHPAQAGPARPGRDDGDAPTPRDRRRHAARRHRALRRPPVPANGYGNCLLAPRALGRFRISARACRTSDPAGRSHRGSRGRLRHDHQPPSLQDRLRS